MAPLVMDLLNMQQASYSLSSYHSEECCKIIHAVKTHFYKFNTQGKLLAVNTSPVCYWLLLYLDLPFFDWLLYCLSFFDIRIPITTLVVLDFSAVRRLFVRLAGVVGRQSALYKENSGFAASTLSRHISTFHGYRILFSIRKPYINRFTNNFSILS